MVRLFEIEDKFGRLIHLSKERWQHICKFHSEVGNYLEDIKKCIQKPTKFIQKDKDKLNYYYIYLKHKKSPNYLLAIVKYLNNHGFIITVYFTCSIK
tara:strand:- start:1041 stop:1331 length:291 start_codon:yes stop_codon:yes gene_type:complete